MTLDPSRYGPAGEVLRHDDRKVVRDDFARRMREGKVGPVEAAALACWDGAELEVERQHTLYVEAAEDVERLTLALRARLNEQPMVYEAQARAEAIEKERDEAVARLVVVEAALVACRHGDGCLCSGGPFSPTYPHTEKCLAWQAALPPAARAALLGGGDLDAHRTR